MLFLFTGCSKHEKVAPNSDAITKKSNTEKTKISVKKNKEQILKTLNSEILTSLKNGDFERFSAFIHPEKGVRFSMYLSVDSINDKRFSKAEFLQYAPSRIKFTWGETDGDGEIFVLSIKDYVNEWILKHQYSGQNFLMNEFRDSGNSLNNIPKVYPNTDFIVNFYDGTSQYDHMDYRNLYFVFEEFQENYYLVAVVNDEWTI